MNKNILWLLFLQSFLTIAMAPEGRAFFVYFKQNEFPKTYDEDKIQAFDLANQMSSSGLANEDIMRKFIQCNQYKRHLNDYKFTQLLVEELAKKYQISFDEAASLLPPINANLSQFKEAFNLSFALVNSSIYNDAMIRELIRRSGDYKQYLQNDQFMQLVIERLASKYCVNLQTAVCFLPLSMDNIFQFYATNHGLAYRAPINISCELMDHFIKAWNKKIIPLIVKEINNSFHQKNYIEKWGIYEILPDLKKRELIILAGPISSNEENAANSIYILRLDAGGKIIRQFAQHRSEMDEISQVNGILKLNFPILLQIRARIDRNGQLQIRCKHTLFKSKKPIHEVLRSAKKLITSTYFISADGNSIQKNEEGYNQ